MHKIKILHVIKSLGRGGAEMLLPETLELHNQTKFEFHYVYFLPWKSQMVAAIEELGGKVECIPAKNNIGLLLQYKHVLNYCEDHQIDLIHCHLPWSGFLGRFIYRIKKIPVIYTEHNIQQRYHPLTKAFNRTTFNSQSLALGVSEDVTESIRKNIRLNIPVKTLLNGVNTSKFKRNSNKGAEIRKRYRIPQDAIVIGNIAVFREQKNIPDWIKAFKAVNENHPETFGLLVGAGPKEAEIKAFIDELHLSEKIILPGLQTDTVSYFSAMDIFMMSSAFEGLPVALLEAMSMQCAVTSTKAGGVIEVIRSSKDGLLAETGDWRTLAANAEEFIKNPARRLEYQNAARDRVVKQFSLAVMVRKLEENYLNLFGKNGDSQKH